MDEVTRKLRLFKNKKPREFAEMLLQLSPEEQQEIIYDWNIWARENQLPPKHKLWRYWLILAGRGFGKDLANTTPILTYNRGWTTMGELEIGDYVFDENGKPTKVINKYLPPKRKLFKFTFGDGHEIVSSEEHEWVTFTHRDKKQFSRRNEGNYPPEDWPNYKGGIYHARSKEPVSYFGPEVRTTKQIIDTFTIGERKDTNHFIPTTKPLEYPEKEYLLYPYFLGYWLGDGDSNGSGITVHKDDVEVIDYFPYSNKLELVRDNTHRYRIGVEKSISCEKTGRFISNGSVHSKLKQLNVYKNKHIPRNYMEGSIDQRFDLLRGLLDSDGYVDDNNHVEFCSINKTLAEGVLELVISLGQKATLKEGNATLNGKFISKRYRVCWTQTVNCFKLKRKAVKFKEKNHKSILHRAISKYEEVNWEPTCCIEVDSPNHLFLAGKGLIPTHNTRTAAEWVIQRAREGKGPIALIGKNSSDVRDTMVELYPSSIIQISPPDFKPLYEPSKRRVTWPNGVVATTFSGDEWDQLRGPQHRTVWCDELPKFSDPDALFEQMDLGLRIGDDAAGIISTTPLPTKLIKSLYAEAKDPNGDVVLTTGSTMDNAANLGKKTVERYIKKYRGTRLERQELFGEILWESETAYFKQEDIDRYRVDEHPELRRIIVAVDPAVTAGEKSDSTGIIVAGVDYNDHIYIIADKTLKGTPQQWASKVGELYNYYQADCVIAEKNQGGDMVSTTIQSFGGNIPVKLVTATRGKTVRAEAPSLLFEQGKIHLVGRFPELEQQMVVYDGSQKKSPDNYDAFIWACTELMTGQRNVVKSTQFYL